MQNSADATLSAHDDAEMFALAPVSLWLEDYSGLKRLFAEWRHAGVTDLRAHLLDDPRRVTECSMRLPQRVWPVLLPVWGEPGPALRVDGVSSTELVVSVPAPRT